MLNALDPQTIELKIKIKSGGFFWVGVSQKKEREKKFFFGVKFKKIKNKIMNDKIFFFCA